VVENGMHRFFVNIPYLSPVSFFAENIKVKQIFPQFYTSISARPKKSDFSRKYEPVSLPD